MVTQDAQTPGAVESRNRYVLGISGQGAARSSEVVGAVLPTAAVTLALPSCGGIG